MSGRSAATALAKVTWILAIGFLITSLTLDAEQVYDAVKQAIQDLPQDMRDAMLLKGIVKISDSDYLNIPNPK